MNSISQTFIKIFEDWGVNTESAIVLKTITLITLIIVVAILSHWITHHLVLSLLRRFIKKSKNEYDDILIEKKAFDHISHVIPALVIFFTIPIAVNNQWYVGILQSMAAVYLVIAILVVLIFVLNAVNEIYDKISIKKQLNISIKGYIQIFKILLSIVAVILIVSILTKRSPGTILAGLGAMTAILLLVFRDSILSFVASIQIAGYRLIKIGDRIVMPQRGADGEIIDISLSTVKVQNYDKTITSIPTYSLVTESFVNWDSVNTLGARRIMRSIHIDVSSIKFCSAQMLENLRMNPMIKNYIQTFIDSPNLFIMDNTYSLNKQITNIGLFRHFLEKFIIANCIIYKKYEKQKFSEKGFEIEKFVIDDIDDFIDKNGENVKIFIKEIDGVFVIDDIDNFLTQYSDSYVLENDKIYKVRQIKKLKIKKGTEVSINTFEKIVTKEGVFHLDMPIMVRQLEPTANGLPLEIYVFTTSVKMEEYNRIQSDLFEFIFAVLPKFELTLFQNPTGIDFRKIFKE